MRPNGGLTFSRKIVTAKKVWDCAALCGMPIYSKEDYVQDVVFDGIATNATLRYHLRCAEPDRTASRATTMNFFHEEQKSRMKRRVKP